jgi:hypothetical protein
MYAAKIVASTNNIPTTYDATAGSLVMTAPSAGHLEVINTTTAVLAITIQSKNSPAAIPASSLATNPQQAYVPAAPSGSAAGWVKDGVIIQQGDKIYLRSDSGSSVSSGTVYFNVY